MVKHIQHCIEGFAFWGICKVFGGLSYRRSSAFGGWLARTLGPRFPVHKVAQKNLSVIFPGMTENEREHIAHAMWEQWGRVAAEYCHIPTLLAEKDLIVIDGAEVLEQLRQDGQPALLFSGHLGNFQAITIAAARCGLPLVQFYRHANNPFVDKGMRRFQQQAAKRILTKGEQGTLGLLRALKHKEHVFVLIDQKFYEGPLVPFMGKMAHTATAVAKMSKRFACPLVPVRSERLGDGRFKVTFYPPLDTQGTDEEVMARANHMISTWVQERPEQWFWVHKRWPFSA